MEIKWAIEAQSDFYKTIEYWENHNGTFAYSLKIIKAVEFFWQLKKNKRNPLFFF